MEINFWDQRVIQNRNIYYLVDDFMEEVPIYNNIIRLCSIFKKLKLRKQYKDILVNLHKYYEKFVGKKF